jgi:hypothetical protein
MGLVLSLGSDEPIGIGIYMMMIVSRYKIVRQSKHRDGYGKN